MSGTAFRVLVTTAILLVVAVLYGPVLGYPFLDLDDQYYVATNPGIRDLSWEGIRFLFFEDQRDFRYFPTSYLSFALDYRLFGADPRGFHATNILLHLANTALVLALVAILSRDFLAAAIAAVLFGVHPLQLESVAWVISRKSVLFLFFFLLSILTYLLYADERDRRPWRARLALGTSILLFFFATTAKTTAATLPAVLMLIDHHRAPGRSLSAFLRSSLPSKLLYLPVILFVAAMTRALAVNSPYSTEAHFGAFDWAAIVGHNVFFYVWKALVPTHLGVFYPVPYPAEPHLPLHYYGFALLALASIALCAWSWRRRRDLFLGTAWYLITILPNVIVPVFFRDIPILAADRFFYQSSIGLFYLAGVGFSRLWRSGATARGRRVPLFVVGAGALTALLTLSIQQRSVWRGTLPLYEQTVRHHPSDAFYYRLALQYANAGEMGRAFRALDDAETAPRQVFFGRVFVYQMRISDLYRRKGDHARAARFLEAAIESTPNAIEPADARTPLAWRYLAHLHSRAGDAVRAGEARSRARDARSDPASYFESTWFVMAPEAAQEFLVRRVSEAPDDALAWYYLGRFFRLYDQPANAAAADRRVAELGFDPDGPPPLSAPAVDATPER